MHIYLSYWTLGFLASLLGGHIAAWGFLNGMRWWMRLGPKPSGGYCVPPPITGFIERGFFTTLVAFDASGIAPAMITWVIVKLATNWNHATAPQGRADRAGAFLALLVTLVSLWFAYMGGLICIGSCGCRTWQSRGAL